MKAEKIVRYSNMLDELDVFIEDEICKNSRFDCDNCDFGIMRSSYHGYSCSIEAVQDGLTSMYISRYGKYEDK